MRHYTLEGSLMDLVETFERLASLEGSQGKNGLLQRFSPLLKIITFSSFIISALLINTFLPLLLMILSLIFLAIITEIDIKKFVYRSIFIPAFALIISLPILFTAGGAEILKVDVLLFCISIYDQGLSKTLIFVSRVWVCVATIILLTSTTSFITLMQTLKKIKVPKFFISITFMTYRYLFLTLHEVYRLLLAKESRTFARKRTINMETLRFLGNVLASLFVRTYERSERVYLAMIARGYTCFRVDNSDKFLSYNLIDIVLFTLLMSLEITSILLNFLKFNWM